MGDFTPIRQSRNPPAARLAAQSSWLPVPPSARGVPSRTLLMDLYWQRLLEVCLAERKIALLPSYAWKNVPKGRVGQQKPKHIPGAAVREVLLPLLCVLLVEPGEASSLWRVCPSGLWCSWWVETLLHTFDWWKAARGPAVLVTGWTWVEIQTQPSSVAVLRHGFPCAHVRPKWIARVEQKVGVTREAVHAVVLEDKD